MEKIDLNKKQLLGQVFSGRDIIEYQTDSVVSKTLINRPGGTVTLFSFDEGQGLSEHVAPFDAMVTILDGSAQITISGKEHHLNIGETIIMPAGEPHALKAGKPFKMMLTMIKS